MKIRFILIALLVILAGMQFFRPKYPEQKPNERTDFLATMHAPEPVAKIIRNTCYDCHSYEYTIPWYGQVAPTSWFVSNHVREGLDEFNMSEWTLYSRKSMGHILEEAAEMVGEGEMPLKSYTLLHRSARLSKDERKMVEQWFIEKYRALTGNSDLEHGHDHDDEHEHEH